MSLFDDIKKAIFLDTATGQDLSRLGANSGVDRPPFNLSDDLLRDLIPLLGFSEKMTRTVVDAVIEAFFGNAFGVEAFEVEPGILHVVIPRNVLPVSDVPSATYLQRPLLVRTELLAGDANSGDVSLLVASNAGFVGGYIYIDVGYSRENLLLDSTTPTTGTTILNLAPGSSVKWHHHTGAILTQVPVEASGLSYNGDFFGVARRTAELALDVLPTAISAQLTPGHNLPTKAVLHFEETLPSKREKLFCNVVGTSLDVLQFPDQYPSVVPFFTTGHLAGTKVTYFDRIASAVEPSSVCNGGNPILLWDDSRIPDLKATLDLVTASGVEVRVVRK